MYNVQKIYYVVEGGLGEEERIEMRKRNLGGGIYSKLALNGIVCIV